MHIKSILLKVCEKFSWSRFILLLFLALGNLPALAAAPSIQWPEKYYNPKPLAGDVILPMPCGGAMTFRKVYTETTGPLGDQRIEIGGSEQDWAFAEHTLTTHVAGAFADTPQSRYLLFGKYEISELQYQALMESDCPEPKMKKRLPQTRVNWHDAVEFTDRYSLWLRDVAADVPPCQDGKPVCIPREEDELGFVRLPTEVEWEYAARGGATVSASDFRERTFPMPEGGIGSYIWFSGSQSAKGKAQLTGLKKPNPLGLHDMLGNVAEIVLEPFRLNRLDRLHGQPGGFIVRGGDFLTSREDIRTSLRQEMPFYDSQGPVRSKTVGFRVLVSVPVITSPVRLREIQQAWNQLGSLEEPQTTVQQPAPKPPLLPDEPLADPIEELVTIAQAATDPNMKKRLLGLRSLMRANIQALNEQRNWAARETLRLGGVLCQKLRDDNKEIQSLRDSQAICLSNPNTDRKRCRRYQPAIQRNEKVLTSNLGVYADTVLATAQNYSEGVLDRQLQRLVAEFERKRFTKLIPFIRQFHEQAVDYGRNWRVKRQMWNEKCAAI